MQGFSVKLDNTEYAVSSNQSDRDGNNWIVQFNSGLVKSTIVVPMESKATRAKVLLFIEAFHEALKLAFSNQLIDQNYVWNKIN